MKKPGRIAQSGITRLRRSIDAIDRKIIHLINARFAVIDRIGRLKAKSGFPVKDSMRMKEVMDTRLAAAAACGLPRALVKKIYNEIIAYSMKHEKKYRGVAGGKRYGTQNHT
jgi:chorismate mutase